MVNGLFDNLQSRRVLLARNASIVNSNELKSNVFPFVVFGKISQPDLDKKIYFRENCPYKIVFPLFLKNLVLK